MAPSEAFQVMRVEKEIPAPPPAIEGGPTSPLFREGKVRGEVAGVSGAGYRDRARESIAGKPPSAPLGRGSRCRQKHGKAEAWGVRCPAPHNNKASGSGRLEAAFVPTGHEQSEEQN